MPAKDDAAPNDPRAIREVAEALLAQLEAMQASHPSADLLEPIATLKKLLQTLPHGE